MRIRPRSLLLVLTFVLVTGLMLAVTGVTFARIRFEPSKTLEAQFSDASGLRSGEDVRASGVTVGTVTGIELAGGGVLVTFDVPKDLPVTTSTSARIRYANLTGDRYLDLTPGAPHARLAPAGWTIPLSHTQPALDLDQLFAGFDPLMRALDPAEINQLTANILAVTEGQAGAVQQLLASVGRFTGRLAERDQIIGETISSFSRAVSNVDGHSTDVETLISGLDSLMRGLADDRRTITDSVVGINRLAADVGGLLRDTRPALKANVGDLGTIARKLNQQTETIERVLDLYPSVIQRLGRGGAYGSFFNFYLCSFQLRITRPDGSTYDGPDDVSGVDRCKLPEDR
jgi:phospholipid/cholesterol/gamma-HCH transport system substrate-binding protein